MEDFISAFCNPGNEARYVKMKIEKFYREFIWLIENPDMEELKQHDGVYGYEYKPPMKKKCDNCLSNTGKFTCEFQGYKGGIDKKTGEIKAFHGFVYKNCPDWMENNVK